MTNLDPQTLELLQETAIKSAGAANTISIVELPKEPRHVYGLVSNGQYERVVALPGPCKIQLHSVDQVSELAVRFGAGSSIYYNEFKVELIFEDGIKLQRDSRGVVDLIKTDEWKLINNLESQTFTQKQLISLLKIHLYDCSTPEVIQLVKACRAIDFSSRTTGSGTVDHGRESMGLDIQQEVISKAGSLPEEVPLMVRIFEDRALSDKHRIRCAIEVDVRQGLFSLTPLNGDLRNAMETEMRTLEDFLKESCSDPVYFGNA